MDGQADRSKTVEPSDEALRAAAQVSAGAGGSLDRVTLRFGDDRLESAFRSHLFRSVMPEAPELDLFVRFGLMIPILAVALIATALPVAARARP